MGARTRILNCEPDGYSAAARSILESFAEVTERQLTRNELFDSISRFDALIVRLGHRIDEEVFSRAGSLKAVATATTGLNHIDLEAASARGISILSLKGESKFLSTVTATAELAFGLILSLARNIPSAARSVADEHAWDRDSFRGIELTGKTLGIIGLGRLGTIMAKYAVAFGMNVVACDVRNVSVPGVRMVDMDELFSTSDFVSVHVSYSPEIQKLVGMRQISSMKSGAYLINTSRGEIIDEHALLNALEAGRLAGAALDVLSGENSGDNAWGNSDKLIAYAHANPRKLIITPHIGGCTSDSMEKTELFIAQKLKYFFTSP